MGLVGLLGWADGSLDASESLQCWDITAWNRLRGKTWLLRLDDRSSSHSGSPDCRVETSSTVPSALYRNAPEILRRPGRLGTRSILNGPRFRSSKPPLTMLLGRRIRPICCTARVCFWGRSRLVRDAKEPFAKFGRGRAPRTGSGCVVKRVWCSSGELDAWPGSS